MCSALAAVPRVGESCWAEPTSEKEGRALFIGGRWGGGGEVFLSSPCKLIGMGTVSDLALGCLSWHVGEMQFYSC